MALEMAPKRERGRDRREKKRQDKPRKRAKSPGKLSPALLAASQYEFGQSREVLTAVQDKVTAALKSPRKKRALAAGLTALLDAGATPDAKQFACRQLALIASAENVPDIAALLEDDATADMARYALEPIPAPEVDEALIGALAKASDAVKVGIVNSLGQRKCRGAIGALATLASNGNPVIAEAAVAALGSITHSA